jgi:hypothetical protein
MKRIKDKLKREDQRKKREEGRGKKDETTEEEKPFEEKPYEEEIEYCILLLDYCQKLLPQKHHVEAKEE